MSAGLPETGFVFCCFNNTWKIRQDIFDIWMRLLGRIEGSVLWLSGSDDLSMQNLRSAAAARGIDPARLKFAAKVPSLDDHLARHRLADLFLDTLPYNAHTTASDALWAGLPVLTCAGQSFCARVASSLLHAAGMPELVTHTLADYEAQALSLACDPATLQSVRRKLAHNIAVKPIFDTNRSRRHVEAAYVEMWERQQRGERPSSFAVPPSA